MKRVFILAALLLPLGAQALDYRNQSLMYLDAPFLPAEAAGISVLTTIGAVEGNPDGTFQVKRTLNRAEFLKIALSSYPRIVVSGSDASRCFPDVDREDWFSKYVCLAKKRGVATGYPDGYFRPENPVNYAEALKILGELYGYTAFAEPDAPWYAMYVQAAMNHKTILPVSLPYDRYLTRGQMARLAAAFRAEYENELGYYRRAENGEYIDMEKENQKKAQLEAAEAAEVVAEQEEQKQETETEAEQAAEKPLVPVQSSILVVGERQLIGDAQIFTRENPAVLRIVKVILDREARSLKAIYLLDAVGNEVGKLKLDLADRDNETWIVNFPEGESSYILPPRTGNTLLIDAQLRTKDERGFSEEMVKVKSLYVMVSEMDDATQQYQIVPSGAHFPSHQTAFTRVVRVENLLTGEGELQQGQAQKLTSVLIEHQQESGATFRIRHLRFWVRNSPGVSAGNWEIRSPENARRYACSIERGDSKELTLVNCLAVPEELGRERVLDLYGDADLSQASRGDTLQINLENPGSLTDLGDIRWSDGSADFQWVDLKAPLAEGRLWRY